jgi:chemotaxis protein methyltransferase WspC
MVSDYLNQIIHLIEKKLGLKPNSVSFLIWEWALKERMTLCNLLTYEDYLKKMQMSPHEIQELIELIVVPETWFFRDKGSFEFLASLFHPLKVQSHLFKTLSLACSTGEEPYSIAMTLFEAGLSRKDFTVDAMDVSKKSLIRAELGVYEKKSFRGRDLNYRDQYFTKTREGYEIKDVIKEQVHFYYANILDNKMLFDAHSYQVIFCRNLFIYLNSQAQAVVFDKIRSLLAPGGFLIVGPAETELARQAGFKPIHYARAYTFTLEVPAKQKKQPEGKEKKTDHHFVQSVSAAPMPPAASSARVISSSFEEKDPKTQLLQEAAQLADEGRFEDCSQLCFRFIHQYGVHPTIYYLLGLIQHALGNARKAEEYFQKTVYLKPSHYEALVYLALLFEKKGDFDKAELYRKRAQKNL